MATALSEALKTPQILMDACLYCCLKKCSEDAQGCLFRQLTKPNNAQLLSEDAKLKMRIRYDKKLKVGATRQRKWREAAKRKKEKLRSEI